MLEQDEIKKVLEIGKQYKYKELCELLNELWTEACNKKPQQLEDWERYFDYKRIDNRNYLIKKIYDKPFPGIENFTYKTIMIPVKCSKDDYKYLLQCNKWSAECWNKIIEKDKQLYEDIGVCMKRNEIQTFVKNITPLHASGNQHVFVKYYTSRTAMFRSMKSDHKNSGKVKLPYKSKLYFPTAWNIYSSTVDYNDKRIYLARKLNEDGTPAKRVCCYFKELPKHIVEIELIYKKGLWFAIKYKCPNTNVLIESNNVAAIDLGEIHSIASIDNNGNAIIITGRKIRSIKRFQNKERGKILSKRSKTVKGSIQYQKYTNAIYNLRVKSDNQISDCLHKISNMFLSYCIENNISKVYYGDLDSCTRGTKGKHSRKVNQKLHDWCYGKLTTQLYNKLTPYGIELIKISEAYTSQTCPHCGHRHKPNGRNYKCQCGYQQHRDLVGAINILNFYEENIHIEKYQNLKYLRID